MIKIGMMIGDRYEILEKIGTGGMSDVYKAKCHKLNRYVAIKVLKQEFSENANFVSKFRIEAQAAAGKKADGDGIIQNCAVNAICLKIISAEKSRVKSGIFQEYSTKMDCVE